MTSGLSVSFMKFFLMFLCGGVVGVAAAVAVKPLFHDGDHLFEM